jgi:hypothetical protein
MILHTRLSFMGMVRWKFVALMFNHFLWSILGKNVNLSYCVEAIATTKVKYCINIIVVVFPLCCLRFWRVGCKIFIMQWLKDRKGNSIVLMLLKVWAWFTLIVVIWQRKILLVAIQTLRTWRLVIWHLVMWQQ